MQHGLRYPSLRNARSDIERIAPLTLRSARYGGCHERPETHWRNEDETGHQHCLRTMVHGM